jgi:tripartite tricarboxylate transporter family receptor
MTVTIGRRELLVAVGGAAAWPFAAHAQQPATERTVGILMAYSASDRDFEARVAAFRQDLRKLGWVEGGNLRIDERWPSDDMDRVRADAAELSTATRSEALPDIPTVAEFVPGYEASGWYGIGAPKATPAEIIDKLNKEINVGLADPKIKAGLANLGGDALASSPADFGKLIADETQEVGQTHPDPQHQGGVRPIPRRIFHKHHSANDGNHRNILGTVYRCPLLSKPDIEPDIVE